MNYRNFSHLAEDIRKGLSRLQERKFDLVVGLPRSGMIPAYMIGLYLNVDVVSLEGFLANDTIKRGSTRRSRHGLERAQDATKILMVDDSISSGNSLKKSLDLIPQGVRERFTTLAVYSSTPSRQDVDVFLEHVPEPRVFEWNVFHRSLLGRSGVDIDGVLCRDPSEPENDDGERYVEFLLNADPLIIPSYKIHSLVTNRLEKYRAPTEQWLKRHGVEYENLVMLDLPSKAARQRQGGHAAHKANYFIRSGLEFFIESDQRQAREIAKLSKKAVYCVDTNQIYAPSLLGGTLDSQSALEYSKEKARLRALLPRRLINWAQMLRGRR